MSAEINEIIQQRDIYYIFRAMHDATCPNCGFSTDSFDDGLGLRCPNCNFNITPHELRVIQSRTAEVLKRRLESFAAFRAALNRSKQKKAEQ